jgi:hypothetical protein
MSRGFEHTVFRRTATGWLALRMWFDSEVARGVGPTRAAAAADMIAHMIPRIASQAFDSRNEKNTEG